MAAKKMFLSWAHSDKRLKEALLLRLAPNLAILKGVQFTWWQDSDIYTGEAWRSAILAKLADCDFGLHLLSPSFFASGFIRAYEVPPFVGPAAIKPILPVRLQPFPLDGSRELLGIEKQQIFSLDGNAFSELTSSGKDKFALDLATHVRDRALAMLH